MATVRHTEGPWAVEGFADRSRPSELRLSVVEPTTRTIVALLSCAADDAESVEATKADAKLIAAAPDLATALEGLQSRYEPGVFCDHAAAPCGRCDAATAALRKAGRLE